MKKTLHIDESLLASARAADRRHGALVEGWPLWSMDAPLAALAAELEVGWIPPR